MKKMMKRIGAVLLAVAMMAALAVTAWAADPDPVPTKGTITINNAGIGETYKAYKVLTAKVGANGAIVYPGPVPTDLQDCFEIGEDRVNLQKKTGLTDEQLFAKLKAWAANKNANYTETATTSTVVFDDVAFGYYVVVSTMDNGTVISVTSTDPNAVTYEKNSTIPKPEKTVDDKAYSIGDTITYTVTFPGANYMQEENDTTGQNAKIVTKYEVTDTLPEFLSDATVTKIQIGQQVFEGNQLNDTKFPGLPDFNTGKTFDIPWADKGAGDHEWTSKYANGTEVTITYTAKLTSVVNVNANNKNTVTVQPWVDKPGGPGPWDEYWNDDAEVTTYAAALKKVDGNGDTAKTLAGAKFKFKGLTVEKTADGVYTVVSYDKTSNDLGTEMEVGADGMLYIVGLDDKADDADTDALTLTGKETEAPSGYNLLDGDVTLTAQVMDHEIYKASGTRKYDADGNLIESTATATSTMTVEKNLSDLEPAAVKVVNKAGSTLPSTGGIGTYVFTIAGVAIMAVAAGLLVIRHKKKAE